MIRRQQESRSLGGRSDDCDAASASDCFRYLKNAPLITEFGPLVRVTVIFT